MIGWEGRAVGVYTYAHISTDMVPISQMRDYCRFFHPSPWYYNISIFAVSYTALSRPDKSGLAHCIINWEILVKESAD